MESSRDKFLKNYHAERVSKPSGKGYKTVYTYIGDYYSWEVSEKTLKEDRRFFIIVEAITGILFFIASFQRTPLNVTGFVAVPAIFSLCAWIFELVGVGFFVFAKQPLKEEDYDRIDNTFFITFILRFLFLGFAAAACIVYTILYSCGSIGWFVTACYGVCAFLSLALRNRYKELNSNKKVTPSQ